MAAVFPQPLCGADAGQYASRLLIVIRISTIARCSGEFSQRKLHEDFSCIVHVRSVLLLKNRVNATVHCSAQGKLKGFLKRSYGSRKSRTQRERKRVYVIHTGINTDHRVAAGVDHLIHARRVHPYPVGGGDHRPAGARHPGPSHPLETFNQSQTYEKT